MKIGFSKINITPAEKIELAGFGYFIHRCNTGAIEDLYVYALAAETNGFRFVIINADLIGLTPGLSKSIERAVELKYGIDQNAILLASTHTHTGPATGVLCGCGEYDASYYQGLLPYFINAVDAAFCDMKEVTAIRAQNTPFSKTFAHNRAVTDGQIDDCVRTVFFERCDASPVALINYSCHPVSYVAGSNTSSDYCGILCRKFSDLGINAIFLNGFCGNINPIHLGEAGCAEQAAQSLFDITAPALKKGDPIDAGCIATCGGYLPLSLLPLTIDEIESEYQHILETENAGAIRAAGIWAYTQKKRVAYGDAAEDLMQYKALRFGRLLFVYHAGETAIEFGKDLQNEFPDHLVIFVGNAFSTTRYVPTEELVKLHGYEGFSSCFAYNSMPVAHHSGEQYFAMLKQQIHKII